MADPVSTIALAAKAGSAVAGGFSAMGKARAERDAAEANAYIGETRAIQTAATAMADTRSELATLRATLSANGQGLNAGTLPFLREIVGVRARERRIGVSNERLGAADWRTQGQNAMVQGRASMLGSFASAAQPAYSLFDLYQTRS